MRSRYVWAIAVAAVAVVAIVGLSAFVEVPGERQIKGRVGLGYKGPQPCRARILHRGSGRGWREEPELSGLPPEAKGVAIGRDVYLAGGLELGGPGETKGSRSFVRYDTRSRRYYSLPDLPTGLSHLGMAVHGNDIYIVGGADSYIRPYEITDAVFRYRTRRHRWERLAPMPAKRAGLGVAAVGHRLYAFGGRANPRRPLASAEVYDIATDRWSRLPDMPKASDHLGVVAHRGQIYVAGGRHHDDTASSYRTFMRYDPRSGRWQRLPRLPERLSGFGLVSVGGRLVTVGGESPRERIVTGGIHAYNPRTRKWSSLPSLRKPVHGEPAAASGGRLYVFGGSDCFGYSPVDNVVSLPVDAP